MSFLSRGLQRDQLFRTLKLNARQDYCSDLEGGGGAHTSRTSFWVPSTTAMTQTKFWACCIEKRKLLMEAVLKQRLEQFRKEDAREMPFPPVLNIKMTVVECSTQSKRECVS